MKLGNVVPPGLRDIMRTNSVESDQSKSSVESLTDQIRHRGETRTLGDIICDRAFQLFDQDNSGDISIDELEMLFSCLGKHMSQEQIHEFVMKHRPTHKHNGGKRKHSLILGRRASTASVESITRTKRRITESGKRLTSYLSKKGSNFMRKLTMSHKVTPIKEEEEEENETEDKKSPRLSYVQGFTEVIDEEEEEEEGKWNQTDSVVMENRGFVGSRDSGGSMKGSDADSSDGGGKDGEKNRNTRSSFVSLGIKRKNDLIGSNEVQISKAEFRSMVTQLRDIGAVDKDSSKDEESQADINPHVFAHDTYGRIAWDIVILILLVYIMLVTPYRVALDDNASGFMKWFELLIDILFIFDLPIQFNTGYIDSNGTRVMVWNKIWPRYLFGYFSVDFISSIPWDYVLPDSENNAVKTLRLAKLLKLLRLARLSRFFKTFSEFIFVKRERIQVLTAAALLCICSHMMACMWSFAGRYGGENDDSYYVDSWQSRVGVIDEVRFDEYIMALYWAVSSVTTVGYGDITPSTRFELCVAIMGMTVGIFLYGWLTAVLTAFFLHEDPHDAMVNNKMSQLTHYLKKHEYPRDMKRQIVSYFHHFYANTSSFDDVQMLQQLPYTLYESAAHFLVEKLIKNFFVFTGIEKDIVALILKVLKPMTSNDEIVKRGQPADTMFLINKGIVNVTNKLGHIVCQFRAGQSFMEYGAFRMLKKHAFNAISVSRCELYSLHADDVALLADDVTTKIRGESSPYEAIGLLRQNVCLLEQFRAYAGCSLLELDVKHSRFEDAMVSMMLGDDEDLHSPIGGSEWLNILGIDSKSTKQNANDGLERMLSSSTSSRFSKGGDGMSHDDTHSTMTMTKSIMESNASDLNSMINSSIQMKNSGRRFQRQRSPTIANRGRRTSMNVAAMASRRTSMNVMGAATVRRNQDDAVLTAIQGLRTEMIRMGNRISNMENRLCINRGEEEL